MMKNLYSLQKTQLVTKSFKGLLCFFDKEFVTEFLTLNRQLLFVQNYY